MDLRRRDHQGKLRSHRLTWTLARRVMSRDARETHWADVSATLHGEGQVFHSGAGIPEQLRRGIELEPEAAAEFWERHPEYIMVSPPVLNWPAKRPERFARWLGVGPDRCLLKAGAKFTEPENGQWTKKDLPLIALVEIKCPVKPEVFFTLCSDPAREHWRQMQYQMFVCHVPRCYYVVYHPDLGYEEQIVEADKEEHRRIRTIMHEFLEYHETGKLPEDQDRYAMF